MAAVVHQAEVQTRRLDVPLVLGMAIAGDEIATLIVKVVEVFSWCPTPFIVV